MQIQNNNTLFRRVCDTSVSWRGYNRRHAFPSRDLDAFNWQRDGENQYIDNAPMYERGRGEREREQEEEYMLFLLL